METPYRRILEAGSDVDVLAGTAELLPLATDTFDLLFCVDVAHHLVDPAAFLREAFRVLSGSPRANVCPHPGPQRRPAAKNSALRYCPARRAPNRRGLGAPYPGLLPSCSTIFAVRFALAPPPLRYSSK
jgi:SAM-dependent methyltransferase